MKEPTTFDDLRTDIGLRERVAANVAAILPNLPDDDRLMVIKGDGRFYSDKEDIRVLQERERPIVPGCDVYRCRIDGEKYPAEYLHVKPFPHRRYEYRISLGDAVVLRPVDPSEYDFSDRPLTTLSDFGGESPYFEPHGHPDRDTTPSYDRQSHLPI